MEARVNALHNNLCTTASPGRNHCLKHTLEVQGKAGVTMCLECGLQFDVTPGPQQLADKCTCWNCEIATAALDLD